MPDEHPQLVTDLEHVSLQKALRESEILRELTALLAASLDLEHILHVLVKRATEVCEVERCAVWLLDESHHILQPAAYYLASQHIDNESIRIADQLWYHSPIPVDNPLAQKLFATQGAIAMKDLREESSMRGLANTFLVRSVLLVALVREGRPVGMLSLDDPDKERTF